MLVTEFENGALWVRGLDPSGYLADQIDDAIQDNRETVSSLPNMTIRGFYIRIVED
jgi:hypothetical protein